MGLVRTCLLACCPELIDDRLGAAASLDGGSLAILGDVYPAEPLQEDLYATVHLAKSGDGAMGGVVG